MSNSWSNWSGFVSASPKQIATPADSGALADLVRTAPGPLRVAGAGHSFTPLVQSEERLALTDRFALALERNVLAGTGQALRSSRRASPAVRLRLIDLLSEASGTFGMAGGQAIDLAVQGMRLDIGQVEDMHARKTGAVIRASVLMAAECTPPLDATLYAALTRFASAVGLAFQIQDDLLDVTGDVSTLGKATGADSERAKPTHPAVIGIPASQQRVRLLHSQAINALAPFGDRAESLRSLAHWLLSRQY